MSRLAHRLTHRSTFQTRDNSLFHRNSVKLPAALLARCAIQCKASTEARDSLRRYRNVLGVKLKRKLYLAEENAQTCLVLEPPRRPFPESTPHAEEPNSLPVQVQAQAAEHITPHISPRTMHILHVHVTSFLLHHRRAEEDVARCRIKKKTMMMARAEGRITCQSLNDTFLLAQ